MSLTAFLVRHAAHDRVDTVLCGRMDGVALSGEGRRQSEWLAGRLSREPVAALRCSPRQRARETAEPIAARLGLPVTDDPAFDEIDLGDWTGRPFAELAERDDWQLWNDARNAGRPPGGESMGEVASRCLAGLDALAAAMPGAGVVIVGHAEPLRAIVLDALGLPPSRWSRVTLDPGSLSVVLRSAGESRLLRLNEAPPPAGAAA